MQVEKSDRDRLLAEIERLKGRLADSARSEEDLEHAEQALQETGQRLTAILATMEEHVILQDREHNILWANRAAAASLDRTPADLDGKKCHVLWHGSDGECPVCPVGDAWSSGRMEEAEVTTPDGRAWFIKGYPLLNDAGEVENVLELTMEVTDRRRAEESQLESEERYRSLAEATFEGILIHDKGIVVDVNRRIENLSGYSRDELRGSSLFSLLEPGSQELVRERLSTGDPSPYEVVARAKDGSRLELEVQGKEIPYKGSTMRVASVRDVRERKAAEAALRDSEERYRLLAENAHDVIWTMDLDLNFTYHSPSVEAQRGFTPEEATGQTLVEIMTPSSHKRVMRAVEEVLMPILGGEKDPNTNVTMELELYRKDGSTILTETSISLMLDADGTPISLLGVTRDITERKAAEEAVDRSESRYRLLAENVEDIIFTLGSDLSFRYVSPSFMRFTGYTIEELIEMGWEGLFAPEGLERIMEAVTDDAFGIMDEGKEARHSSMMIEVELIKKDGSNLWVEVNVSAIFDDDGDVKEILGVARDISERKATQERFLEEKKRAELYLDLFGHDIRNINQGIMSYLELMLMRPGLDPDEADYIKSVLEQATRINDLVAKVQRLTQLRSRRIEVEEVDAEPLIQAAIDYVVAKYPFRNIKLNTSCTLDYHVVRGSRFLTDVFTSILDNAVRFNRQDTVEVDIYCRRTEDGKSIQFVFEDRGPGIADETKDKVFHRLEQPEGGINGSGLGLAVVWEIMRQLGGRVWVEDRVYGDPGQGSRFVVELPFADP
jgi:PAS domain S-box-containing protein